MYTVILDLGPRKENLSLINNKILYNRRNLRKKLKEENDILFEQRQMKHQESKYIRIGDW